MSPPRRRPVEPKHIVFAVGHGEKRVGEGANLHQRSREVLDAGLVRGVNADVSRQALIVGLVHFGAVSGAQVLAEGLETEAEQETVQRLGVTLGQGYRLAPKLSRRSTSAS